MASLALLDVIFLNLIGLVRETTLITIIILALSFCFSLSLALTPVELYTKSTVLQTRIRLGKVERSAPSQIVQVTGSDSRYGLQNGELI